MKLIFNSTTDRYKMRGITRQENHHSSFNLEYHLYQQFLQQLLNMFNLFSTRVVSALAMLYLATVSSAAPNPAAIKARGTVSPSDRERSSTKADSSTGT